MNHLIHTIRALAMLAVFPVAIATAIGADTDRQATRQQTSTSVERRAVAVSPNSTVHIQVGTGTLRIHTWMHDRVSASVQAASSSQLDVATTQDGAVVVIDSLTSASAVVDVYVPINAQLSVFVGDGDVVVDGLVGRTDVHVGRGNIHLANVRGEIDALSDEGTVFKQIRNEYGELEDVPVGDGTIAN